MRDWSGLDPASRDVFRYREILNSFRIVICCVGLGMAERG
jgi:hypothetical protein